MNKARFVERENRKDRLQSSRLDFMIVKYWEIKWNEITWTQMFRTRKRFHLIKRRLWDFITKERLGDQRFVKRKLKYA